MSIRLAVRALLLDRDRLLIVNAFPPKAGSDLWCAPGGGAVGQADLPANLAREVLEETGLEIAVDAPCLVNEFHDPDRAFHQVEIFFRCRLRGKHLGDGRLDAGWVDPEGVVTRRRWVSRPELEALHYRPAALPRVAWQDPDAPAYDPLKRLVT